MALSRSVHARDPLLGDSCVFLTQFLDCFIQRDSQRTYHRR